MRHVNQRHGLQQGRSRADNGQFYEVSRPTPCVLVSGSQDRIKRISPGGFPTTMAWWGGRRCGRSGAGAGMRLRWPRVGWVGSAGRRRGLGPGRGRWPGRDRSRRFVGLGRSLGGPIGRKSRSRSRGGTPGPVSVTVISANSVSSAKARSRPIRTSMRPPAGVACQALSSRLARILLTRAGSAFTPAPFRGPRR